MIPKPWARTLTGGSTGGWDRSPSRSTIRFLRRRLDLLSDPRISAATTAASYLTDQNAFTIPRGDWLEEERLASRTIDGQPASPSR
jgi:hypothetical protein